MIVSERKFVPQDALSYLQDLPIDSDDLPQLLKRVPVREYFFDQGSEQFSLDSTSGKKHIRVVLVPANSSAFESSTVKIEKSEKGTAVLAKLLDDEKKEVRTVDLLSGEIKKGEGYSYFLAPADLAYIRQKCDWEDPTGIQVVMAHLQGNNVQRIKKVPNQNPEKRRRKKVAPERSWLGEVRKQFVMTLKVLGLIGKRKRT